MTTVWSKETLKSAQKADKMPLKKIFGEILANSNLSLTKQTSEYTNPWITNVDKKMVKPEAKKSTILPRVMPR